MYYVQYVTGKWFAFEKTFQVLPTTVYVSVLASEPTGWKSKGPEFFEGVHLPRGEHD